MKITAPLLVALTLVAGRALADDERRGAEQVATGPTIAALTHDTLLYDFELTAASIQPSTGAGRGYAWILHNLVEVPIVPRAWYVGMAQESLGLAIPQPPGAAASGQRFAIGSPEIWGRGVWTSVLGLSAGGSFGAIIPTPQPSDARSHASLAAIQTLRPWTASYYQDRTLTLRPSLDIRYVMSGLTFQLRQGLDWSVDLSRSSYDEATCEATSSCSVQSTVALTMLYAGYRVTDWLAAGVEVVEAYKLTSGSPDDEDRATVNTSATVRFILPRVEPAVSLTLPVTTPNTAHMKSYYALRFDLSFNFDWPAPLSEPKL